jgi:diguanylate cyclase (GGDEF)-like protein
MISNLLVSSSKIELEFPEGTIPLNSPFYIERPPLEALAYAEIGKPACVLRLRGPDKMGKSSLLLRTVARATELGYRVARLDFQQVEDATLSNLDKFLRWLCAMVSRQLHLEAQLDDYWDEDIGSKVSCTLYWQGYLLEQLESPLFLVLEDVQRLFEYPTIYPEFLPLLRSWHEEAKQVETWQKLRLAIAYSTKAYMALDLNQSPFNVGLPLQLPGFCLEQVQELALRHGLDWAEGETGLQRLAPLQAMLGGHPYLIRLAFYHLHRQTVTMEQLLQEASTPAGIYRTHLRSYLGQLRRQPELVAAMMQVVAAPEAVELEAIAAHKLESMGLVQFEGDRVVPSCQLYRQYFHTQLARGDELMEHLWQLEEENKELRRSLSLDRLTQLLDREHFEQELNREWQQLAQSKQPLSVLLCQIDYFSVYNNSFGRQAGDECLRQIARTLCSLARRSADVIARYNGTKFALLLPDTDTGGAIHIAEQIQVKVRALAIAHDTSTIGGLPESVITVSLGVATAIFAPQATAEQLINTARLALVESQKFGGNRITHKGRFV